MHNKKPNCNQDLSKVNPPKQLYPQPLKVKIEGQDPNCSKAKRAKIAFF